MSIYPVQAADSLSPQLPDRSGSSGASVSLARKAHNPVPDSGTPAKRENQGVQDAASAPEMPQDEVEVQREGKLNGEIVIKYLDRSGDVILQVPSPQVLNLDRSIAHDTASPAESPPLASAPQARAEGEHTSDD